jgi:hypothetical protein
VLANRLYAQVKEHQLLKWHDQASKVHQAGKLKARKEQLPAKCS